MDISGVETPWMCLFLNTDELSCSLLQLHHETVMFLNPALFATQVGPEDASWAIPMSKQDRTSLQCLRKAFQPHDDEAFSMSFHPLFPTPV